LRNEQQKYNPKPTFVHVMFYSNVWAVLYMGAGVLVTGETVPATLFTIRSVSPPLLFLPSLRS
jgi:hypothetical protein